LSVFVADEQADPIDLAGAREVAQHVLDAERLPPETEVAVVFVDGDQMARYNQRFMDRHGPTDVLAFPLHSNEPGRPPVANRGGPPIGLGDVFICPAVVMESASVSGAPLDDEMALMVVHGMLHLLGWDHKDDQEAERMEARERELLAGLGRSRP